MSRLLRLLKFNQLHDCKSFHTSSKLLYFWERDRKGGFPILRDVKKEEPKDPLWDLWDQYKTLRHEFKLLKEEVIRKFKEDPPLLLPPGEVDIQWQFKGDPAVLQQWVVSQDSDYNIGRSTAKLELSSEGHGVFSGVLDTRPIQDGKIKYAGYCNIKTVRPRKSFHRLALLDWSIYTHLVLHVRGDGRSYAINLHPYSLFDVHWNDLHNYVLYTRGGPYWQYVKIPFSKFFLSSKGRVQDKQFRFFAQEILAISFTAANVPGPFRLEIDYIGVERDLRFQEELAYEMYKPPNPYYS